MKTIVISEKCGNFAENKDVAKYYRESVLKPFLNKGEEVTLDFSQVDSATQSFLHAMLSELFQNKGEELLNKIYFKNCNITVKSIIGTVISYSLE